MGVDSYSNDLYHFPGVLYFGILMYNSLVMVVKTLLGDWCPSDASKQVKFILSLFFMKS